MAMPADFTTTPRCPSPDSFPKDEQLPSAIAEYYLPYCRPLSIASDPFHVMAMMSCFSAVIGPRCYVRYGNLLIYASISSILLGLSTMTGKSEALNLAKQTTLDPLDRAIKKQYDAHRQVYDRDMAVYKKLNKQDQFEADEPVEPVRTYLRTAEDFTNSSLKNVLVTQNPHSHGSIMLFDEFSAFLMSRHGSHTSGIIQLFTKIHSCESVWVGRAGEGDTFIELPFLNIVGCSTPEWLIENMQESDVTGGWLIRYLVYEQKEKPDRAPPSMRPYPDKGLLEKWNELITDCHTSETIKGEWRLTEEAIAAYDKIYHKIWDKILLPEEDKGDSIAGRSLNMIFRVALLFEILNTRGNPKREGSVGEKHPVIQLKSMKQAIKLVVFYMRGMMAMRKTTLTGGNLAVQEKLLQRLRKAEMSKSEVYRFCTSHKKGIRSKDIQEIYTSLDEQQIITIYPVESKGKHGPVVTQMVRLWEAGDDAA
jgi:hypothetical protein